MFRQEYAQLAIFDGLTPDQIRLLSPFLEEVSFSSGATVFEQGQLADCIYILLEGEVVVRYKPYDGPALTVARVHSGGVFGWSAALGRSVYTSAAQAGADPVKAYRLRGESLQHLCDQDPQVGGIILERLASVIAERLRNTHTQILNMLSQGMDVNGKCARKSE